jgi:bacterioferritin
MRHAEWLIQRILFLEGTPNVSAVNAMHIGKTVHAYNAAIRSARDVDDQVTADLLITILKMEEELLDWGEIQQSQIEQIGLENHLTNQTEGTG